MPPERRRQNEWPERTCHTPGACGKDSHLLEVAGKLQVLIEQVAKVRDRKGVHPVVVGWVPVAFLHHQAEPGGAETAEGSQSRLLWEAL